MILKALLVLSLLPLVSKRRQGKMWACRKMELGTCDKGHIHGVGGVKKMETLLSVVLTNSNGH